MDLRAYKGKRICVACSGGEDSVCLLHYLKSREEKDGFFLSAVHVEHGIRGEESKADAAFVAELCKSNEIPFYLYSADCLSLWQMICVLFSLNLQIGCIICEL